MDTSVIGRVKKFQNDLYHDGGIRVCKFCQHSLSSKLSTIQNHMDSFKHKRLVKQVILQTSYKSLENRTKFFEGFRHNAAGFENSTGEKHPHGPISEKLLQTRRSNIIPELSQTIIYVKLEPICEMKVLQKC